jgi:hypothetical protein
MPADDLAEATRGMRVKPDAKWVAKRREKLERQLAELALAPRMKVEGP